MPVDFVNRTGYGGVPGYTKPPDVKQRRRARDLSQTNMRKAAGHKTFEQLEEILRSKIMEKTKSGGLVLFRMFRKFDTNKDGVLDKEDFKYLEKKTKDELEALGRKIGIELDKRQTKAKLIAALKKAKKKLKV